jgi:hypothetical protein
MLKNCAVLAAIVSIATSGALVAAGPAQASASRGSTTQLKTSTTQLAAPSVPKARGGIYPNDSCWD